MAETQAPAWSANSMGRLRKKKRRPALAPTGEPISSDRPFAALAQYCVGPGTASDVHLNPRPVLASAGELPIAYERTEVMSREDDPRDWGD